MTENAEAYVHIRGDANDMDRAGKQAAGALGFVEQRANAMAAALMAAAGAAVAALAVTSVRAAGKFETGMANIGTLIDGNKERMAALGDQVLDLSVKIGKSAEDLQGGLYQVISAFGDSAESMKITEVAAKAATAGLSTTNDAVNLLAANMKGYGDTSAVAAQKTADLAFQAVKLGQTTFPALASAMGRVIPLAAALAVKQEELWGTMATLTGVTGNTAEVSTQFRAILQALINPTEDMKKGLDALGFSSGLAALKALGLTGTLQGLVGHVDGNQQALAKMFGQVEALNAVLALSGPQFDTWKQKIEAMTDAMGTAERAFAVQAETYQHNMDRFKALVETYKIGIGTVLLPGLNAFMEAVIMASETIPIKLDLMGARIAAWAARLNEKILRAQEWLFDRLAKLPGRLGESYREAAADTGRAIEENKNRIRAAFGEIVDAHVRLANVKSPTDQLVASMEAYKNALMGVGDATAGAGEQTDSTTSKKSALAEVVSLADYRLRRLVNAWEMYHARNEEAQGSTLYLTAQLQNLQAQAAAVAQAIVDLTSAKAANAEQAQALALKLDSLRIKEAELQNQIKRTTAALHERNMVYLEQIGGRGVDVSTRGGRAIFEATTGMTLGWTDEAENLAVERLRRSGWDNDRIVDWLEQQGAALAHGGRVLAPGLALVGERGPEILRLPRAAQVAPLDRAAAGNVQNVYNINVTIPARDLAEMRDVSDFFARISQTARASGMI